MGVYMMVWEGDSHTQPHTKSSRERRVRQEVLRDPGADGEQSAEPTPLYTTIATNNQHSWWLHTIPHPTCHLLHQSHAACQHLCC